MDIKKLSRQSQRTNYDQIFVKKDAILCDRYLFRWAMICNGHRGIDLQDTWEGRRPPWIL